MTTPAQSDVGLPRRSFAIIFGASFAIAMGNTGLTSVLPAIGRSIGIPDALVAAIFSLSSLIWAAAAPMWAKASDRRGRKPLIITGMAGFLVSMTLCGLLVAAGLRHLAPWWVILIALLFARSIFGFFGAATNPASQAYVAERVPRAERTQTISSLAGAQGLGTVVGPFLAPLFILPFVGLSGPLFGFGLFAGVMVFVVWRYLPEGPVIQEEQPKATEPSASAGGKAPGLWRDARVAPFLIYALCVTLTQGALSQIMGFLVMDTLKLDPAKAQGFIAVAMMFGAISALLAQWGLIRLFSMTPRDLLRWGAAITIAGQLLIALSDNYWMAVTGYAASSIGFGFARPGFTAGASLAVGLREQARVAGALAALAGFNVATPLFVGLYQLHHDAPFLLNATMMGAMLLYAFRSHALREAGVSVEAREEAVEATIERPGETS